MDTFAIIEKIKEIDRQSFIQKCKIMTFWQKNFHVDFQGKMPDELTFADLMEKVENENEEDVYQALKKLVKHGVDCQQKQFLYNIYAPAIFLDDGVHDFDCLLDHFATQFREARVRNLMFVQQTTNQEPVVSAYFYASYPVPMLECFFQTEKPLTEALLVQNGYLLILRAVVSVEEEMQLKKLKTSDKGEVYEL